MFQLEEWFSGGAGLALVKPMGALKNGVVDFTKNQVNRVVNHTVLNRVINEVDNIAGIN